LKLKEAFSVEEEGEEDVAPDLSVIYIGFFCLMVFHATFNNISVISWQSVFIGGGNRRIRRIPLTCRKSLTNFYNSS
jgi:hypothetical protein